MTASTCLLAASGARLLATVLAGCGSSDKPAASTGTAKKSSTAGASTSASPSASPSVDITAPAVHTCHNLGPAAQRAPSESRAPVDCTARHTTWTYRVGTDLPDGLNTKQLRRMGSRRCASGWREAVGGTDQQVASSMLELDWFLPTPARYAAGARGYRCDVANWFDPKHMFPLVNSATGPVLTGAVPTIEQLCLTSSLHYTSCGVQHAYRVSAVHMLTESSYPGDDAIKSQADSLCRGTAQTSWPGRFQWRFRPHAAVCYSKV